MAKYVKLIPGFVTNIDPERVHIIGSKRYDFKHITEKECVEIIDQGSEHVKKAKLPRTKPKL